MKEKCARALQLFLGLALLAGSYLFCRFMPQIGLNEYRTVAIVCFMFLNVMYFVGIKRGWFDCCVEDRTVYLPNIEDRFIL